MAPERFEGHSVEPKWDLWALGVIAYEMLAGVRPFEGASVAEFQAKILSGKFKPIAEHVPHAPADWQLFFERALALSSDDRPSSAKSLCDELERALA